MYDKTPCIYLVACDQETVAAIRREAREARLFSSASHDPDLAARADLILCPPDPDLVRSLRGEMKDQADLVCLGACPDCLPLLSDIWPPDLIAFHFRNWLGKYGERVRLLEKAYFLDAVLSATPNMVWFKNRNGAHELVNRSFCAAVGKPREAVEGKGHAEIWNVESEAPACIESEQIVMSRGITHQSEEEIPAGDGKRLLQVLKAPLRDRDGAMMGTVGIAMDITEERKNQELIIQNNSMLETLFETMDCGMLCQSLDGKRVISANPEALRMLGYRNLDDLREGFDTVAKTVLEEDKPVLRKAISKLSALDDSASYEYRARHKNGRVAHIIGNARLVERNGELVCRRFLLDCTEQKLAEEKERRKAEKRQNELLRALSVDFQLVFICMDDGQERVLQLLDGPDRKLRQIFAKDAPLADRIEEYIAACCHPDEIAACRDAFSIPRLREKLAHEKDFHFNYRTLQDGQTHYFTMRAIAAGDNEKAVGIVVGLQSIDDAMREEIEQKSILAEALKQAQRANSAKSIFLSNMSHDIRTPLNAVLGYANLAINRLDRPEAAATYLRKIQDSGRHLISLINDILDVSHIESGRIHLDETLCNLPELVSEMTGFLQPETDRKHQELRVEIGPLANPDIYCDRLRLKQVILNLLGNAVKYTGENGTIELDVRQTRAQTGDQAQYEISITDNGIGMDADFLGHIFEPFERAANVGSIQGTGLGMAITKSLIDLMKGEISIQSEPGKGTRFLLKLTFRVPAEAAPAPACEIQEEAVAMTHKGARILLAEDNEMNQEIASEILREAGYQVEIANNGREAVDLLKQGPFDVVLMDVQMPVMNGYEATSLIRALEDQALASIPIIAMTANSFEEDKQEALNRGMNAHIAKPINFPELFATLDHFLALAETGDRA